VKRFTLSEQNAEHVYDWLRMYCSGERERFGGCLECEEIGRRLERFIGPTAVRRVGRGIKAHKSIVRDQPGRPVAASCAISGCHYSEATTTVARMKKKHGK